MLADWQKRNDRHARETADAYSKRAAYEVDEARMSTAEVAEEEEYVETTEQSDWESLKSEVEEEIMLLQNMRATFFRSAPNKALFGDPLQQGVPARYIFWPSNRDKLPLLYIVASVILCVPATSTPNESLHSVIGIILRKLRNSLTDENLAYYVLLRAIIPGMIKRSLALKALSEQENPDPLEVEKEWRLAMAGAGLDRLADV